MLLMIFTFLPFNEGIIAKSARWKKLSDAIEVGVVKAFTWRANANVTNELDVLILYFKRASIALGITVLLAGALKSYAIQIIANIAFLTCFCAWFAFKWTFKHGEAIKPFWPPLAYSLVAPWIMLLLGQFAPEMKLMVAVQQLFGHIGLHPSPFQFALILSALFLAFFATYYFFLWLIFSPFAYGVLLGLKLSQRLSQICLTSFNRNLLNELSY